MRRSQIWGLAALWVFSAGCTTWRQATPGTPLSRGPVDVRLQLTDGSALVIRKAQVQGDSLVGESAVFVPPTRVAVALADVRSMESREFSRARTLGLIGGVVAGGIALFLAIVGYAATTAVT